MLNFKLSKPPPLPTHLGGSPTLGAICGLWRVTWKHPPAKTSPPHPKGPVPERLGQAVPRRGAEVPPPPAIGDRAETVYLGSPPGPPPPLYTPVTPRAQEGEASCRRAQPCAHPARHGVTPVCHVCDRKDPHLYPPPSTISQAAQEQSLWTKKPETGSRDLAPQPGKCPPCRVRRAQSSVEPLLSRAGEDGSVGQPVLRDPNPDPPLAPGDP